MNKTTSSVGLMVWKTRGGEIYREPLDIHQYLLMQYILSKRRQGMDSEVKDCITYRAGYKYQLAQTYTCVIEIRPDAFIRTPFIRLDVDGTLSIIEGYAWDGASGPAIDTANFMRGSLVHDALYQLIRGKQLEAATHRKAADLILQRICMEDGMSSLRAWWVYQGVRFGGGPAASNPEPPHLTAP